MALHQIFDFLKEAVRYIRPDDEALAEAGEQAGAAARYHKRIVIAAAVCGLVAAVGGTIALTLEPPRGRDTILIFAGPAIFGSMGILIGVAGAALFAPREFLTGPLGRKWMALIGTRSVLVARIVCGVLLLFPLAAVVAAVVREALKR